MCPLLHRIIIEYIDCDLFSIVFYSIVLAIDVFALTYNFGSVIVTLIVKLK